MKTKLLLSVALTMFTYLSHAQKTDFSPTPEEIQEMNAAIQADSNLAYLLSWFGDPDSLYYRYKRNLYRADSAWQHDQKNLGIMDIGSTNKFELIPLVDWFTIDDRFKGEGGVAYLIRTDEATILFDLGLNAENINPSPLLHNMEELGITVDEIDFIVISHDHDDHVGGSPWTRNHSFSLSNFQMELNDITVFTPGEMTYPGLKPVYSPQPVKIAEGVATLGVIHKPSFVVDIAEQALAVNVAGKGIVVISGCGHQSVQFIVERTETLFHEPLYALIGGFHYPMQEGRNITWLYKYFVVGKLPWERLTTQDIEYNIGLLKTHGVKLVGISAHDSDDRCIEMFRDTFKNNYVDIRVGEKITLNE